MNFIELNLFDIKVDWFIFIHKIFVVLRKSLNNKWKT